MVVFDVEGTLIRHASERENDVSRSAWYYISKELGEVSLKRYTYRLNKWKNKEYKDYTEWSRESLESLRNEGLNKDIFERVANKFLAKDGVRKVIASIDRKACDIMLVSGGFSFITQTLLNGFEIDFSFSSVDLSWGRHGNLSKWFIRPTDYEGKAKYLQLVCTKAGYAIQNTIFIGDGDNDIYAAKSAGFSIAVGCAPAIIAASSIRAANLREASDIIECYLRGR